MGDWMDELGIKPTQETKPPEKSNIIFSPAQPHVCNFDAEFKKNVGLLLAQMDSKLNTQMDSITQAIIGMKSEMMKLNDNFALVLKGMDEFIQKQEFRQASEGFTDDQVDDLTAAVKKHNPKALKKSSKKKSEAKKK